MGSYRMRRGPQWSEIDMTGLRAYPSDDRCGGLGPKLAPAGPGPEVGHAVITRLGGGHA